MNVRNAAEAQAWVRSWPVGARFRASVLRLALESQRRLVRMCRCNGWTVRAEGHEAAAGVIEAAMGGAK